MKESPLSYKYESPQVYFVLVEYVLYYINEGMVNPKYTGLFKTYKFKRIVEMILLPFNWLFNKNKISTIVNLDPRASFSLSNMWLLFSRQIKKRKSSSRDEIGTVILCHNRILTINVCRCQQFFVTS